MAEIKCPNCGEVFTVDESSYATIVKQIRDKEFDKELNRVLAQYETEKSNAVKMTEIAKDGEYKELISKLQAELVSKESEKKLAVTEAIAAKDKEISGINAKIIELENNVKNGEKELQIQTQSLKAEYEAQLKGKDTEIEFYKNFKAKLSTKMVGESLEQHCSTAFNQLRATAFPNAYFEKDNDAKKGETKGDFIFRDYGEDGTEYISIMFEMKNENDTTSTKQTNESFLERLDENRRKKNCEYAVLVSLLESESDLYNTGIVDMSYKYPKMYVIRPQFFIPIITLLRDAAKNSLKYQQELAIERSQTVDISNFENEIAEFKDNFGNNFRLAGEHYEAAIKQINNSIDALTKARDKLNDSMRQLKWAKDKADDLSIKKLTKNNPTMKQKFDELEKTED